LQEKQKATRKLAWAQTTVLARKKTLFLEIARELFAYQEKRHEQPQ
jgi:hypothetical protein